MKYPMIAAVLGSVLSQISFAANGQENEGLPACQAAQFTCSSQDKSLFACVFSDQIYLTLAESSADYQFPAERKPVPAGIVGAGAEFVGPSIDLAICTDCAPSPSGWSSVLNVPSLNLDKRIYCEANE